MALIYASAVNKRMHQLQKKRSMDTQPPNSDLLAQQMSLNYGTKVGRSIQRDEHGTARSASRDCVGEVRKRSAPPGSNRSYAVAGSAGRTQQLIKLSPVDNCGRTKHWRKLTVADGQFSMVNGEGGSADTVAPRRKISMPQTTPTMVMMMSAMAMEGIKGGTKTKSTTAPRAEVIRRPKKLTREKKSLNNLSSYDDDDDSDDDYAKNDRGVGGFFAQFTAAFRRRSVSMDDRVLRPRHGTFSSSDSISASPVGDEYGSSVKGTRPQRRKESNTFRKMRDRLNKWKMSN